MSSPIDVTARWSGQVWTYTFVEPCLACSVVHRHGGGNARQPDLAIGQTGWWTAHCLTDEDDHQLRLVSITPRP